MSLINEIRNKLAEEGYAYPKSLYVLFFYVSGVYTGVIAKDKETFYLKEETPLPSEDTFLSGYVFNEDIQLDLENDGGLEIFAITPKKLEGLDPIEENMFVLTDDKNYAIGNDHVTLHQGNKVTVVPGSFTEEEVKRGITLRVVNYVDYDSNDIPFVRYMRLMGFYPYEAGRKA